MVRKKHPSLSDLKDFIQGKLNDSDSLAAGKHLAGCDVCLDKIHNLLIKERIDSWNTVTHGIAYQLGVLGSAYTETKKEGQESINEIKYAAKRISNVISIIYKAYPL